MPLPASIAKLRLIDPHLANAVVDDKPLFIGGYPLPGPQSISGTDAMSQTGTFVDDNTWRILAAHGHFDDIVVGSGFCALAYITTALERNPNRRILLLERGGFWLQDHVQNLPAPFQFVRGHHSETFPWELSYETAKKNIYMSGSSPFFGGRSSFWSIWSPRAIGPAGDDMRDFPEFMKDTAKEFYGKTERLLHVESADSIDDPVFKAINLQGRVTFHLNASNAASEPARLATALPLFGPSSNGYRHFSVIASLLTLKGRQNMRAEMKEGSPIMIATDTVVERFEVEAASDGPPKQPAHARILHTSRGPLTLRGGKTNVILAAGAIPNTTILLNSIKDPAFQKHAGQRLTAHFRSQVMARFKPDHTWFDVSPQEFAERLRQIQHPVISAHHVRGKYQSDKGVLQWHIQLHGTYIPQNFQQHHVQEIQGVIPDLWSAPTSPQLVSSGGYVVMSASVLGELPEDPTSTHRSRLELLNGDDVTKNIRLHLNLGESAQRLWQEMVIKTFETVRNVAGTTPDDAGRPRKDTVEFWNYTDSEWREVAEPTKEHYSKTVKPFFHEASTNYMTEAFPDEASNAVDSPTVNKSYRPLGLAKGNVYVTGAGLFPTAGSWNPTPTICALAQHLATTLVEDTYLGRAAFNYAEPSKSNSDDTYFFNGGKYVKINWKAHVELPVPADDRISIDITEFSEWRTLSRTGFREIDAIVPVPQSNSDLYVFSGPKFARIKLPGLPDSNPLPNNGVRLITDSWPTLKAAAGSGFTTAICGALIDPNNPTQILFFSGDQYVRVWWHSTDIRVVGLEEAAVLAKPTAISNRWKNIPEGKKFNTIFPDPRNDAWAYLFSGTKFWRINLKSPGDDHLEGDVAIYWPSLKNVRFI